ncbi:hypothetical protein B0J13DRAFT_617511 [Dactylonectria estremocensis]|uniref:Uncharacterized protein n=1 Tax=Dactylonectria estremocensis TaxID=1079267 RepID=A0A9P9JEP0_9HYPO|nr:hypothetical protein B0J13DRAFT_617511 [Dactylonectria estremocensis]
MATTHAEVGTIGHNISRLPKTTTAAAKLLSKTKRKRPTISGPLGPIKNSRGPDFVRSEHLIIVPEIKDCSSEESLFVKGVSEAKKTARRISASFQKQGPPSSQSTTARSDFNATTTCQINPPKRLPITMSLTATTTSWITPSLTFDIMPGLDTIPQDENAPPPDHEAVSPRQPTVPPKSQLTKSRTLSVLTDLKSSISRPSLASRSANSRALGGSSRVTSLSSSASTLVAASSSCLRPPRPSLTSVSRSSSSSTPETPRQLLPGQIGKAQPSAYWSGRFMALHDRFLAESLDYGLSQSPIVSLGDPIQIQRLAPDRHVANLRPTHLSHSTTTSALTTLTSTKPRIPPVSDDETRCLRVFLRLGSCCITPEARRSLHDWQQTYARRVNRPGLLPEGGTMHEKGMMNRIFGSGMRKSEIMSLSALREASNARRGIESRRARTGGKLLSVY